MIPQFTFDVWEIAGVFVAVVSLAAMVLIPLRQRTRKELSYAIESDTPVVTVGDAATRDVEIRYRGVRVRDVRVLVVKLWNSGNVPVRTSDFETPITLALPCQLLDFEVQAKVPSNLVCTFEARSATTESGATISPMLLNKGDSVTFRVLVSGLAESIPPPQARIAGVKQIAERTTHSNLFPWLVGTCVVAVLCMAVGIGAEAIWHTDAGIAMVAFGASLGGIGTTYYGINTTTRERREELRQMTVLRARSEEIAARTEQIRSMSRQADEAIATVKAMQGRTRRGSAGNTNGTGRE